MPTNIHSFAAQAVLLLTAACCTAAPTAKPIVEMEVLAEPGWSSSAAAQQWAKILAEIGVSNVRFRGPEPGERPTVKASGTGRHAEFRITAQLNSRGAMVTPGGQFAPSDRAKLSKWLSELTSAGPENLGQSKTVFGLYPKQYDQVRSALRPKVGATTKGANPPKVLEQIRRRLELPLAVDPAIDQALAADDPVRDELQDVSLGTALAAIARPVGAVLLPKSAGGTLELHLTLAQPDGQSWPIGWPPDDKKERDLIPMLFDFLNVDISDVPATEAIAAIQGRLKVPFLYDHNNMLRHKIDLSKRVTIPPGKTYYKRAIDRVLFQTGLKCEVRVDEAGEPIVWITTLKS
ncbi:MAG: hypothetical protein IT427_20165 [Pirellulales bacterium]|nr:hypothetical protein [Pirellulales bacterium]